MNKVTAPTADATTAPTSDPPRPIILVLGMIYGILIDEMTKLYGQEWRDTHRILSLHYLGFTVYSMDDKHDHVKGKHCNANFNLVRRMHRSLMDQNVFPSFLGAQYILLDYFFSPVSIISILIP